MARPVIATKLYVPRPRPGLVPRPRLLERLRQGAESRLTLVSAPAGFGKSTLLAAWLGERAAEAPEGPAATSAEPPCVAWVSLDHGDSDPASFWTYVLTAIRNAAPEAGANALAQLEQDAAAIEPALTTLVNELAQTERAMTIVLDDYHLAESPEVGEGLAFLLEHLPPQVHVVVSTRADPGLPLSRMRVRRELVEIRAADLRFTTDEAAAYLQSVAGLHLARADVAVLEERTEGWIAALQLAALSLQGRDDAAGFIAGFAGDDRYIVDYLVEEVLAHQPGPVRDFLLRSAVLDRLTGPLCDAVTGNTVTGSDDGSHLLVTLERANLFIVPLDDRREWFRFHHLFADVLRARLSAEQPELVPLLHQRASRWFEQHDLPDEAITHALAARDLDRATYLIELAVPAIRRLRQESVLIGWLRALPEDAVRRSPVLSVYYAFMLMATGDVEGIEAWLDAAERALAEPPGSSPPRADTDDLRTLPATIAVHRASLAQARGDVAGTTAHARRALELAGPGDHAARGGAAGFLGLAAWARGDVSEAIETFGQAVASLRAAGNVVDELSSTVLLADMWLVAGRPGTARRLCAT
ncbi:MAG: helix-turn-helix transcriptional regulator, partial [Terracoccus sp.]